MVTGGQSATGGLIDQFLGVGQTKELIDTLTKAWEFLGTTFADEGEDLKPLTDLLGQVGREIGPCIVATFVDIIRIIAGAVVALGGFVKLFLAVTQLKFGKVGDTVSATGEALFGEGGILTKSAVGDLAIGSKNGPYVPPAPTVTSPGGGFQRGPLTIDNKQTTTINVNGAGDPNAVGQRVASFQHENANQNAAALAALATGAGE